MIKNLWNRLKDVSDSPNLMQDVLTLLSAPRLLVWFLVFNGVTCLALGIGLGVAADSHEVSQLVGQLGFGQFVATLLLCCLGGMFTIFVPLRVSGLFWGPRLGRYLDQIVLSGITPVRYFFGKMVSINLFVMMFLCASIPYFIFSIALGGFDFIC
ncbi:hypothetical protein BVY04_00965 [bacterium M21]|nr:hypothetical protein BVY04_00965 [bacterium M21]